MFKNNKYFPWIVFVLVCVFAVLIILKKTDEITSQSEVVFTPLKTSERAQKIIGNPGIESPSNAKEMEGMVKSNDGEYLVLKTSGDDVKFNIPFRVEVIAEGAKEVPRIDQIKPNIQIRVLYNPENMIPAKVTIIPDHK